MNGGMEQGEPNAVEGTLCGSTRISRPDGSTPSGVRDIGVFTYQLVYSQKQIWLLDLRFNPCEPIDIREVRRGLEGWLYGVYDAIEGHIGKHLND